MVTTRNLRPLQQPAMRFVKQKLLTCRVMCIGERHIFGGALQVFESIQGGVQTLGQGQTPARGMTVENLCVRGFFRDLVASLGDREDRFGVRAIGLEIDETVARLVRNEWGAQQDPALERVPPFESFDFSRLPEIRNHRAYWLARILERPHSGPPLPGFSDDENAGLAGVCDLIARLYTDEELIVRGIDYREVVTDEFRRFTTAVHDLNRWADSEAGPGATEEQRSALISQERLRRLALRQTAFNERDERAVQRFTEMLWSPLRSGERVLLYYGMEHLNRRLLPDGDGVSFANIISRLSGSSAPTGLQPTEIYTIATMSAGTAEESLNEGQPESLWDNSATSNRLSTIGLALTRLFDIVMAEFVDSAFGIELEPVDMLALGIYPSRSFVFTHDHFDAVLYFRRSDRWGPLARANPSQVVLAPDVHQPRVTIVLPDRRWSGEWIQLYGFGLLASHGSRLRVYLHHGSDSVEVVSGSVEVTNDSVMSVQIPPGTSWSGSVDVEVVSEGEVSWRARLNNAAVINQVLGRP